MNFFNAALLARQTVSAFLDGGTAW